METIGIERCLQVIDSTGRLEQIDLVFDGVDCLGRLHDGEAGAVGLDVFATFLAHEAFVTEE